MGVIKPKLFIGSSVEGLKVAYALQENLQNDAEVTVWSQGVFQLSESSLDSLLSTLEISDFGIFVFTPDDYIKIRGKSHPTIRDNVLFELGLFVGRLNKRRCFIVTPNNKNFHLPTDLIGMTPGVYEADRVDENLQAGTGTVCHKIIQAIQKLGPLNETGLIAETVMQNSLSENELNDKEWFIAYLQKDYDKSIEILRKKIKTDKDVDNRVNYEGIICDLEFEKDSIKGNEDFIAYLQKYRNNNIAYYRYSYCLYKNNSFNKAIAIIDDGLNNCERKINLCLLKADCLWEIDKNSAIAFMNNVLLSIKDHLLYLKLADFYKDTNETKIAAEVLHKAFFFYPNSEQILSAFASICYDIKEDELSILLYSKLTIIDPQNANYWCFMGNSYLNLGLNDLALKCYEKAAELSENSEGWIIANIGNLYNNKELYDKAEQFLKKSLELDNSSDYTHDRLSQVYKHKAQQNKKLQEILSIAKIKLNSDTI